MRAEGRPPRDANEDLETSPDGNVRIVWCQETFGPDGRGRAVQRPGYPDA